MDDSTGITYNEYYEVIRARRTPREVRRDERSAYWRPILTRLRNQRLNRYEAIMLDALGDDRWDWYSSHQYDDCY